MSDPLDDFLEPVAEEPAAPQEPETPPEPAEPEPAPAAAPQPDVEGLKAAMIAERRKRQELEAELARKAEEERPFLGEEYEARFKETESRFQQELTRQKLDLSESFARNLHADFDEKLEVFTELVKQNPALYQHMVSTVNPAEFAYKVASDQMKLKEMANPEEYEAKIAAKIEAKLRAEYEEKMKKGHIPPTLADARGGAGSRQPEWSGPTPLGDLLK